ncbi:MFS transporter [Sulfuracidifex metallicus]|uniref:MFS transporter n=2 Tax=Sulfuracidifex metallicus TaxID=47303 RepID=A0A6A9QP43_SULME|nr:MFS transporter [Sulfuracidifex metallicus]MUN29055.1 MFS transporter [Sulfuracidifex metallicus DSM 6482 = JCM 9184]WOE50434.1 MFS transporter [Sulfuracidifex metallicus DSM 6482 = JCM 9184]
MKPLRTITLLNSIASSLSQPYFSFLNVINGVTGPLLGVVSSSFTAFPSIVQGIFSLYKAEAKNLITWGFILSGLAWILLFLLPYGSLSTLMYVIAASGSGASTFGYSIIMEKVSRGARGAVLSQYAQYARIGSLLSTVGVGLLTGDQYYLMKWFFLSTGLLYLISSYISTIIQDEEVYVPPSEGIGKDVMRMILVNSSFYVVWAFAWPLFPVAEVEVYHMNEDNLAIITLIGGISGLLFQRRVGMWMDRNRRAVMFAGRIGLAIYPLAYSLATNVYQIYAAYLLMGITGPANIAYTSFVYDNTKNVRKAISFMSLGEGIGAIMGSLLGSVSFVEMESLISPSMAVRLLLFTASLSRIAFSFFYLSLHDTQEKGRRVLSVKK